MSIKRSSKSMGTGARKPVSAAAVRHVEVMAPQLLVSGNTYCGWLCKNKSCGLLIAMAPEKPGSKPAPAGADDPLIVIQCPHCRDENLYRWGARGEHTYQTR
jgi:hypothetical protein